MQLKKCGPYYLKNTSSIVWNKGSNYCRVKQIENFQDNKKIIYTVQVPRKQHWKSKPTQVAKENKKKLCKGMIPLHGTVLNGSFMKVDAKLFKEFAYWAALVEHTLKLQVLKSVHLIYRKININYIDTCNMLIKQRNVH